jgi:chemotaxis protein CheD
VEEITDIFLQPGEHFVGDASYRVRTLLGSCVSITLWCPTLKVGAMSHFLLSRRGSSASPVLAADGRFGEEALMLMLRELRAAGVQTRRCEAKIFGGGSMFPGVPVTSSIDVGRQNGEAARAMLKSCRIPVVSESLFGIGHRQIIFEIESGEVWARQVPLTDRARLAVLPA